MLDMRDFMPKGGAIAIRVNDRMSAEDLPAFAEGYVCLTVTDDGHGLNDATPEGATQPFFSTKGVNLARFWQAVL